MGVLACVKGTVISCIYESPMFLDTELGCCTCVIPREG